MRELNSGIVVFDHEEFESEVGFAGEITIRQQNLSVYYMKRVIQIQKVGVYFQKVNIADEKSEYLLFEMGGNGADGIS